MLQLVVLEQRAVVLQDFQNGVIRLVDVQTGEQLGVGQEHAVAADRVVHFQTIAAAHHIVVLTVTGRGVHGAGAGIGGDVFAQNNRRLLVIKRMLQQQVFQFGARGGAKHFGVFRVDAIALQCALRQRGFEQQTHRLAVDVDSYQLVFQLRVQRHRLVGGQRPRRGGPDHHCDVAFSVVD